MIPANTPSSASRHDVEAAAWRELMTVPGMTVATASRIGETPVVAVRRWLATPATDTGTGA